MEGRCVFHWEEEGGEGEEGGGGKEEGEGGGKEGGGEGEGEGEGLSYVLEERRGERNNMKV